jgi:hypothetical protein
MRKLSRTSRVVATWRLAVFGGLLAGLFLAIGPGFAMALNDTPPPAPVRLIFIHHSVGENWLCPENANLLGALNDDNYYVSDTYYGWGPDDLDVGCDRIGDHTDIGHWYNWFLGPNASTYLSALYTQTGIFTNPEWVNSMANPDIGGENRIVMFKSCFPNSGNISGNPDDPPRVSTPGDPNPLWGASSGDSAMTVSNIKGLYRDLLQYFATRQDKLYILITSPPVCPEEETVAGSSERARALNTWLVHHWLDRYPHNNVAVFDFFNVLTSNGGDIWTNDLGAAGGNHHRLWEGKVQHLIQNSNNYGAYAAPGDSHPTPEGGQKAKVEFLPLLNTVYHAWQGTGGRPWYMGRRPRSLPAMQLLLPD